MRDLEKNIKEAFDAVRAEPELKDSAMAYIAAQREKRRNPFLFRWARMAAAAACMALLFFGGYGTAVYFQPVSVISVDINPSLELGINAFDRVISVDSYNDDGRLLAEGLSLRNRNCFDAVEAIIASDTVQSLMAGEDALILTVVGGDTEETISLCSKLEDRVGGVENTHCRSAVAEVVEEAHHCGLSYGKYLAYLEALEGNGELTPEQVQAMTMRELRELSGGHHGRGYGHHGGVPMETSEATDTAEETTAPAASTHGHGKKHRKGNHH